MHRKVVDFFFLNNINISVKLPTIFTKRWRCTYYFLNNCAMCILYSIHTANILLNWLFKENAVIIQVYKHSQLRENSQHACPQVLLCSFLFDGIIKSGKGHKFYSSLTTVMKQCEEIWNLEDLIRNGNAQKMYSCIRSITISHHVPVFAINFY